jgi:calcium-dependent protein kinase
VFRSLDRNGDGRLSKEELMLAYRQHNTEEQTQEIVENVMRKVDVDKNGFIDYSEFLAASISHQTLTSKANLDQAFRLFDKDGSGKITIQEVKEILGGDQQMSDSTWQQVMKEVDANSDGEIDLKEFIGMMLQSIK